MIEALSNASKTARWVSTVGAFTLALACATCGDARPDPAPVADAPRPATEDRTVPQSDSTETRPPSAAAVPDTPAARAGRASSDASGATDQGRSGADPQRETPPAAATDQDPAAQALRAAARAYERLRSLRAGFTMVVDNPLLRRTTTSHGTLYQRSPDRIKLAFTDPAGDVIVGDGTWFWIHYPSVDSLQVLRSPAVQGGSGVDLRAQFVGDPLTKFRSTLHGSETVAGREARVLTLVPVEDAGYRQLKVWLDVRDGLARRFEITEHNGINRRFDLENLEINPVLEDAIFRFTPPPGARIIERE